jgi:hypothetical protein
MSCVSHCNIEQWLRNRVTAWHFISRLFICTVTSLIISIEPGTCSHPIELTQTTLSDRSIFPVISGNCPQAGTILNATNGIITDGPGDYPNDLHCWWTIAPNDATKVELRFTQFLLEGPSPCCYGDFIEFFECPDIACQNGVLITKLSGTMASVPRSVISSTGIMRVHFFSDLQAPMRGFDSYYFSPCPAGTFGPGLPNCSQCTSTCEAGKQLRLTSCGAIGATSDNECVCRAGAFLSSSNGSCIPCRRSCGNGGLPGQLSLPWI